MGGLFVRRVDFNLAFYQLLKYIVKIYLITQFLKFWDSLASSHGNKLSLIWVTTYETQHARWSCYPFFAHRMDVSMKDKGDLMLYNALFV